MPTNYAIHLSIDFILQCEALEIEPASQSVRYRLASLRTILQSELGTFLYIYIYIYMYNCKVIKIYIYIYTHMYTEYGT